MEFAFDRLISEYSGHFAQSKIDINDWKHVLDLNERHEASKMFVNTEINLLESHLRE